jgi:hypothetical protein
MTRLLQPAALLLAVLMLAGCGGSDPTTGPPPTDLEGVCTIRVTGTQGGETIDFAGEFDLEADLFLLDCVAADLGP